MGIDKRVYHPFSPVADMGIKWDTAFVLQNLNFDLHPRSDFHGFKRSLLFQTFFSQKLTRFSTRKSEREPRGKGPRTLADRSTTALGRD